MRKAFKAYILDVQGKIVSESEKLDPNAPPFFRDDSRRPQGGYGIPSVFSNPYSTSATTILENPGVNISAIDGALPPAARLHQSHGLAIAMRCQHVHIATPCVLG